MTASLINKPSKEEFEQIVKSGASRAEILRTLGYVNNLNSALYKALKRRMVKDGISEDHIPKTNLGREFPRQRVTKEKFLERLSENRLLHNSDKKLLIRFDLIEHRYCAICKLGRTWNNLELNLQIDHIDGDPKNNNLSNLRFICPNCHSQTDTFCGKNLRVIKNCEDCGCEITKVSKTCQKCAGKRHSEKGRDKKITITKEELQKLVWEKPVIEIAKELNCSDVAIHKKCKRLGVEKPPTGHWLKR